MFPWSIRWAKKPTLKHKQSIWNGFSACLFLILCCLVESLIFTGLVRADQYWAQIKHSFLTYATVYPHLIHSFTAVFLIQAQNFISVFIGLSHNYVGVTDLILAQSSAAFIDGSMTAELKKKCLTLGSDGTSSKGLICLLGIWFLQCPINLFLAFLWLTEEFLRLPDISSPLSLFPIQNVNFPLLLLLCGAYHPCCIIMKWFHCVKLWHEQVKMKSFRSYKGGEGDKCIDHDCTLYSVYLQWNSTYCHTNMCNFYLFAKTLLWFAFCFSILFHFNTYYKWGIYRLMWAYNLG